MSLFSQSPALQNPPHRYPMGESVLGREGDERGCILVRCVDLSAALVESGDTVQGKSETKGVRAFLREGERCLTSL